MDRLRDPPEGYSDYEEYQMPEHRLQLISIVVFVVLAEVLFPGVINWFVNSVREDIIAFLLVSLNEVLLTVGLIIIHEAIHFLMGRWRGLSPDYGIRVMDTFYFIPEPHPYIVVLDEFLSRNDNIVMLVTPLLIIDIVALIGMIPRFPEPVTYYATIAFITNTSFSAADAYHIIRLSRMPEDTRFINVLQNKLRTFYCVPVTEE